MEKPQLLLETEEVEKFEEESIPIRIIYGLLKILNSFCFLVID